MVQNEENKVCRKKKKRHKANVVVVVCLFKTPEESFSFPFLQILENSFPEKAEIRYCIDSRMLISGCGHFWRVIRIISSQNV